MSFLTDRVVCNVADTHNLEIRIADLELIADSDIRGEIRNRMLNHHIRQIRADALVQDDQAIVVLEKGAGQIADCSDGNFILDIHRIVLLLHYFFLLYHKFC